MSAASWAAVLPPNIASISSKERPLVSIQQSVLDQLIIPYTTHPYTLLTRNSEPNKKEREEAKSTKEYIRSISDVCNHRWSD